MPETLFEELKRYVEFGAQDEQSLRELHPLVLPDLPGIAEVFYDRILAHAEARKALEGGESQVGRLKPTLVAWMDTLLTGPWDEAYYEKRARIGRVHVRIALPQHYMFGAMNVLRQQLNTLVDRHFLPHPKQLTNIRRAVGKILDLELAIMLHTYREDLLSQQARIERLSTFGQLVGSIGHELRNPLGVIETSLYILKGKMGADEKVQKHVGRIEEQLAISNDIVTKLLDMIRDKPLAKIQVGLAEVLAELIGTLARPEAVEVRVEVDPALTVDGDRVQLRQVFSNLITNAIEATGLQGTVEVKAHRDAKEVEVTVEDTGPGVDPAIRRRLFEPLVTTRQHGVGLGLALVKRIVERHAGTIAYQSRTPQGARFVVRLPSEA